MSPSIVPSGNFTELYRTVTCMVLKAKVNDRRTPSPLPRSDYVRQALESSEPVSAKRLHLGSVREQQLIMFTDSL
ncbi:hypothetical protein TNCV_3102141 [Trichonephila clavipes]|nr:hypothetical protein TNCV_3102141 [Trichonephila clavipes]